ncbi:MAG: hypothetical protein V3U86_06235 [Acidobacteriota bacterium]
MPIHPTPDAGAPPVAPDPPAAGHGLRPALWLGFGALAEIGYLIWARPAGGSLSYGTQLALYLFLFIPVLLAVGRLRGQPFGGLDLRWALGFAVLFRLTLLFTTPVLSDDIYRYIWDGKMQLNGINPFQFAPDDPALADLRDELHPLINHPEVPTLYPPLSQLLFAAAAFISTGVVGMKALWVLVEIGTWLALLRLWRLRALSPAWFLLYLWNPLVIIEGSGSGHNDVLGVGLLVCSSVLIILGRSGLSITVLGAAVAAKLFPIIALPAWMRVVPKRFWVLPPLLWAALWAPYLGAGARLWEGLLTYGRHWESNAFLFRYLRQAIEWLNLKEGIDALWGGICTAMGKPGWEPLIWPHTEPRQIARLLVAAGLACAAVWLWRAGTEPPRAAFRLMGLVLVLAPTVHPWYLLWVLPFAAWYRAGAWFVFSATIFLSYAPAGWAGLPEWALLWLEYVPFLAVWGLEGRRRFSARGRQGGPLPRTCR